MPGMPSKRCGYGGIVIRMSSDAIASASTASQRSCASMKRASSARSSALGSRTDQSARRAGRWSCIVARARCSALFAAATLVSSNSAVSLAGQPSTSRHISAARCFGGSTCSAARNASSIVSRSIARASGWSISSSSRSGYGSSQETSPVGTCRAAAPQLIEAHVGGDAVQPRPEERVARERVERTPRAQVRLLHRVLGLVERGEHPVAVHVQLSPVAFGDAGERGFVSRCVCHARYNAGPRADSSVDRRPSVDRPGRRGPQQGRPGRRGRCVRPRRPAGAASRPRTTAARPRGTRRPASASSGWSASRDSANASDGSGRCSSCTTSRVVADVGDVARSWPRRTRSSRRRARCSVPKRIGSPCFRSMSMSGRASLLRIVSNAPSLKTLQFWYTSTNAAPWCSLRAAEHLRSCACGPCRGCGRRTSPPRRARPRSG